MQYNRMWMVIFALFVLVMASSPVRAIDASAVKSLTLEKPLLVDKAAGSVSFLAEVNGKYFFNGTRHAAVFKGGKFGDKAVFRGFVTPRDLHAALIEIGAKPGENMTLDNKEKTNVEGDAFEVTVTWQGASKEYALSEVIKDSNNKPMVIRFGGNMPNSLAKDTGCLICLDSCPVGICSNATYTYGAVETRNEVSFTGIKDVLPPDGSQVVITMKRKK